MYTPRTDLALDAAALSTMKPNERLDGVETEEYSEDDITVTRVKITNEAGEKLIGKPAGSYVTIECAKLLGGSAGVARRVEDVFSYELMNIIKNYGHRVIFVAGLGNRFITPDSLGPRVSDSIAVNRHISEDGVSLCTVSPGVLGVTGIETGEIIEGVVSKVKPDIIIAIDALASRSMHRICTTIQISDTGITPGAGVGNRRRELSIRTLGVPVIAVGVPTVVDAATVANDSLDCLLGEMKDMLRADSSLPDDERRYALIKKILNPYFGELIVTPSEIDSVISRVASVIAGGINRTGHNPG